MEVTKHTFQERLPEIIAAIDDALFVSFDFEYSGVTHCVTPRTHGRKMTVAERYLSVKHSAQQYQVFQMGLCTVSYAPSTASYVARPFNFYVNPIVDKFLGLDRKFSCSSDAMDFLQYHDFDFNKLFREGVQYMSLAEENAIREKREVEETTYKNDIHVDASSLIFLKKTADEIKKWLDYRDKGITSSVLNVQQGHYQYLNISTPGGSINGYQKRLVHQLVRKEFPSLSTRGKKDFVQISVKDAQAEQEFKDYRKSRFNKEMAQAAGLRRMIDRIIEKKKVIVGHNCFQDMAYLYRTFIGDLPGTVEDFRTHMKSTFGMIIDTKYLATYSEDPHNADGVSSLSSVYDSVHRQNLPEILLHHDHTAYAKAITEHVAGYDAWLTAKVFLKKALKLHVTGYDVSVLLEIEDDGRNAAVDRGAILSLKPFQEDWVKLLDLELTPAEAVIPTWDHKFWSYFGNRLRVFGTEEGVFRL